MENVRESSEDYILQGNSGKLPVTGEGDVVLQSPYGEMRQENVLLVEDSKVNLASQSQLDDLGCKIFYDRGEVTVFGPEWEKYADGYFSDGFYEMNLIAMNDKDEIYEDPEPTEDDESEDSDDMAGVRLSGGGEGDGCLPSSTGEGRSWQFTIPTPAAACARREWHLEVVRVHLSSNLFTASHTVNSAAETTRRLLEFTPAGWSRPGVEQQLQPQWSQQGVQQRLVGASHGMSSPLSSPAPTHPGFIPTSDTMPHSLFSVLCLSPLHHLSGLRLLLVTTAAHRCCLIPFSCPTGAGSVLVGTWHDLAEALRKDDQLMARQGGSRGKEAAEARRQQRQGGSRGGK
ncbi:unnamed protein product [Closterium sp. NIES-65]|nr:unnamed protein product [Closterium sp. NIES-65]